MARTRRPRRDRRPLRDVEGRPRRSQAALERTETNRELRERRKDCASMLAADLVRAAAASGVPVAPRVARSIRVKSRPDPGRLDRRRDEGRIRGGAGLALVWGSEQGPKSDPTVSPSRRARRLLDRAGRRALPARRSASSSTSAPSFDDLPLARSRLDGRPREHPDQDRRGRRSGRPRARDRRQVARLRR